MAQDKDDERKVDEEEDEERSSDPDSPAEPRKATGSGELVKADTSDGSDEPSDEPSDEDEEEGSESSEEEGETAEDEEQQAAAQLGSDRYVLAGFFAAGMTGAYILGRAVEGLWINFANKDWFSQSLPRLAAVSDSDKGMYSIMFGGLVALVIVLRTYRKPDVREWADEVAAELQKVVWPSRKEVTSSTFIVIIASTVATLYLTLLDRLWAFVTNIVYGDGS
jgi:preprotein translocase subunit SecE